jgi:hypothetical protein
MIKFKYKKKKLFYLKKKNKKFFKKKKIISKTLKILDFKNKKNGSKKSFNLKRALEDSGANKGRKREKK